MATANLAPGMRVECRGAEWLVTRVERADRFKDPPPKAVHCVGTDDLVRGQERVFLEQLDTITLVDPRQTVLDVDDTKGYQKSKLFLEAQLRNMPVAGTEPDLAGMGVFRPMDFQREAVQRALLQLRPRLLLADAVGLGKTIEVGMILTELMRRGRADRILVLARKSMLTQFQAELWNRFAIPLVRLDSRGIAKLRLRIPANKNPFEVYHRIIVSIDTLKDVGRYRHFLEETHWDVVVIDEAHNVAGASVPEKHKAYRLARLLSRRTDSLLLTTATPHNGKRETFGRLISLLDPSIIPDPRLREYDARDIREFFLMRFKEDVRDEAGDNFKERMVVPEDRTSASASPEEEAVFAVFAEMREFSKGLKGSGRRADRLVQYGLYKLFLSSPEACRQTVSQRLANLERDDPFNPEISHLSRLASLTEPMEIATSTRYAVLKQQLADIGWNGKKSCPRVLIFTEYRRTQDALAEVLAREFRLKYSSKHEDQKGQTIGIINGGMTDVNLMATVEAFGTGSSPLRMLIATDVASEGLNLHHQCHDIIHFDLPWSIITLIQRNGRIDRFGQEHTPCLRYLQVLSSQRGLTGDRDIFTRLIAKVEEINRATRSGESVLKLYDPEAEERYIAEKGLLDGDADVLEKAALEQTAEAAFLEELLSEASREGGNELRDFLRDGDGEQATVADPETEPSARLRLLSDEEFLLQGYRYLADLSPDYRPLQRDTKAHIVPAPADLKRRLGAPDARGDVIFGATAIPVEVWPEHDQFQLTSDQSHADLSIKAAQNTSGHWARVQMVMEQHPILRWIGERLLMQLARNEAPYVVSHRLPKGRLCYCFIGQVSSRAGTPLVVDAHAVLFDRGGDVSLCPLERLFRDADVKNLVNAGELGEVGAAQGLVPSAVEQSLQRMRELHQRHRTAMQPLLDREEQRLRMWESRRQTHYEHLMADLTPSHPRYHRYQHEVEEMTGYLADRVKNWKETYFEAGAEPSTRLVLVMEGTHE